MSAGRGRDAPPASRIVEAKQTDAGGQVVISANGVEAGIDPILGQRSGDPRLVVRGRIVDPGRQPARHVDECRNRALGAQAGGVLGVRPNVADRQTAARCEVTAAVRNEARVHVDGGLRVVEGRRCEREVFVQRRGRIAVRSILRAAAAEKQRLRAGNRNRPTPVGSLPRLSVVAVGPRHDAGRFRTALETQDRIAADGRKGGIAAERIQRYDPGSGPVSVQKCVGRRRNAPRVLVVRGDFVVGRRAEREIVVRDAGIDQQRVARQQAAIGKLRARQRSGRLAQQHKGTQCHRRFDVRVGKIRQILRRGRVVEEGVEAPHDRDHRFPRGDRNGARNAVTAADRYGRDADAGERERAGGVGHRRGRPRAPRVEGRDARALDGRPVLVADRTDDQCNLSPGRRGGEEKAYDQGRYEKTAGAIHGFLRPSAIIEADVKRPGVSNRSPRAHGCGALVRQCGVGEVGVAGGPADRPNGLVRRARIARADYVDGP